MKPKATRMKQLYETVLEHDAGAFSGTSGAEKSRATPEAIQSAETKLGVRLPKTFKRFVEDVGSASWPVIIYSLDALMQGSVDEERPSYLLAFAADGGGNEWCFDTRKPQHQECPIVFWDHEEPPDDADLDEQGPPTTFDAWLDDQVSEKLDDDGSDALAERQQRIESALERQRETNTWPWAPGAEDVAGVEASIGFTLPEDYVWFTTTLGSTPWPLAVVDALEMGRLTDEMRERFPTTNATAVAFGRETDGTFVAFQRGGRPIAVGGAAIKDRSFFDFLERRIEEES